MAQWYCIVGGQQYGPVTEDVLRSWGQAGRLRPVDYVWCEGMPEWVQAATVPNLFPPGAAVGGGPSGSTGQPGTPGASMPGPGAQPPGAPYPGQPYPGPQAYLQPHRGAMILVFGILGLICNCIFVFGIISWAMGNTDLREIDSGRMDPSGRGMTQAGKICGIIGVILGILNAIGVVGWLASASHHMRF